MSESMDRICSMLVNRDISHSSFRLLVALIAARSENPGGSDLLPVSREGLQSVLPGVNGKEVTESTIRHNLRELEKAGVVEVYQSIAPDRVVLIHVKEPSARTAASDIALQVISRPGLSGDAENL